MVDAPEKAAQQPEPETHNAFVQEAQHIWSGNSKTWKAVFHGKGTAGQDLLVAAEIGGGLIAGSAVVGAAALGAGGLGLMAVGSGLAGVADGMLAAGTVTTAGSVVGGGIHDLWHSESKALKK
ncbi:MAG TPA: hypothetical protein V6C81_13580 [Planktothrix sp.]|jgi:hypothetical protein